MTAFGNDTRIGTGLFGMTTIAKRRLGRTSLEVTEIGFGGTALGNIFATVSDREADESVRASCEAGINHFDTAPLYGHGLSEHRLGDALRRIPRDRFVLSTKIGRLLVPARSGPVDGGIFDGVLPFEGVFDYNHDGAMRSFEDSLQRLGINRVDVLYIHDVDRRNHGEDYPKRFREAMDGAYRALERLRGEGTVTAIGAGVNEWEPCRDFAQAGDFDCFLLAGRYSLLEQDPLESFLPLCEERGISLVIGGPFNSGILATGAVARAMYNYAPAPPAILDRVRRIEVVCRRHDVPLAAADLQFPLGHPVVASVIPGGRSGDEVKTNLSLMARPIPDDLWQELKAEGLLRSDAPTP